MRDEGERTSQGETTRDSADLLARTKRFALDVIHFYSKLPNTTVCQVLGRQLLGSATSVGAHYREAQRAKSTPDFISKIEGGLQELDESLYWLELLEDSETAGPASVIPLKSETDELLAIFVSIARSAKRTSAKKK
jgi:four helix bundle protein